MTGTIEALEDVQKQMAAFPDRKEVAVLIGMIADGLRGSPKPFESLVQINEELEKLGELDGDYAHVKTVIGTLVKTGLDAESDEKSDMREHEAMRTGSISLALKTKGAQMSNTQRMSTGSEGVEGLVPDVDQIVDDLFSRKKIKYHDGSEISPNDAAGVAGTDPNSDSDNESERLVDQIFGRRRVPVAG